jgi:hypothetical protein
MKTAPEECTGRLFQNLKKGTTQHPDFVRPLYHQFQEHRRLRPEETIGSSMLMLPMRSQTTYRSVQPFIAT